MSLFISLLRGVNVSGKHLVRMADLAAAYEKMGHRDVKTYLQSGNVVFSASGKPAALAEGIRQMLKDTFDIEAAVLVIPATEFARIAEENPFLSRKDIDPAFLHVTFLAEEPRAAFQRDKLPLNGDEDVELIGRNLYLYCPHGYGNTKINNSYFERLLKISATTRNWKTVQALREMTVH